MSSFMNKMKEAFHSDKDKDKNKSSSQKEGSHGPRDSRTSNTGDRDPRVESDRGYRDTHGSGQNEPYTSTGDNYAYGGADQRQAGGRGGTGDYGRTQPRGAGTGYQTSEYPEGTYGGGAHSDQRYDPAYDSSRRTGETGGYGTGHQGTGTYGTESGAYGTQGAGAYDSGAQGGTYGQSEGAYETHGARGDEGHHAGRHSGSTGAAGTGGSHQYASTGPAPNTAGPHKSDMMNKLDPRVDSDLDGSKTYMGNKTFSK